MNSPAFIQIGSLQLDVDANQLIIDNDRIQIEPKLVEVLCYLKSRQNQVVTRENLLAEVWHGQVVSDNAITRSISQVRKYLELSAQPRPQIETIPRVGYRLNIEQINENTPKKTNENKHANDQTFTTVDSSPKQKSGWLKRKITVDTTMFKVATFILFTLVIFAEFFYELMTQSGKIDEVKLMTLTELPGVERKPRYSPNGQLIAFNYRPRRSEFTHLYLLNPATQETTALLTSDQIIVDIAWRPGSNQILISQWDNSSQRQCSLVLVSLTANFKLESARNILSCGERALAYVAWHPDGDKFYYNDRASLDRPYSIYSYSLTSNRTTQLTLPPQQSNMRGDYYIFSGPGYQRLGFLRYKGTRENELLVFDPQEEKVVEQFALPENLSAISWFDQSTQLLMKQHDKLFRFDFETQEKELIYPVGENSADFFANFEQTGILYATGKSDSNLYAFSLNDPDEVQQLTNSTAIEIKPSYANLSGQLAFFSDRSGSVQIWLRDEQGREKKLSDAPASLEISRMNWSPDDSEILFQYHDEIYSIDVASGEISRLIDKTHLPYVVSWSNDGESIFYSAEKSGEWQIWQWQRAANVHRQITTEGGYSAFQHQDGSLYFSKLHQPGLWRINLNAPQPAKPELIFDDFEVINWSKWWLVEQGVYYYSTKPDTNGLMYFDFNTQNTQLIFKNHYGYQSDFTLKNNQIVISVIEDAESRIEFLDLGKKWKKRFSYWSLFQND